MPVFLTLRPLTDDETRAIDRLAHSRTEPARAVERAQMVWRARRLGYSVVEVPIRFEDRVAGASKVSRGEVRRALWTVLRLSLGRWKR